MENYGTRKSPIFTPETVPRSEWSSTQVYGDFCRYEYPGPNGAENNQVILSRLPDQELALLQFKVSTVLESVSGYPANFEIVGGYANLKVGTDVVHIEVYVFLSGTADNAVSHNLSRTMMAAIADHLRGAG